MTSSKRFRSNMPVRWAVAGGLLALMCAGRPAAAEEPAAVAEALTHATALSRAFRHAAEKATPSVVVVRSEV
jgi:hypothetical protein